MTQKQYETYKTIKGEIDAARRFIDYHRKLGKGDHGNFIVRERCEKRFFLKSAWSFAWSDENIFEIPDDLLQEIFNIAEKWIKEKEEELEKL